MGISAPLAGLMIFLLMLYFFRSAALVVAPMLVAMATVIISMGLLISAGFTVHIMSSMIPIFLMPIAVVDSVHIMSEFADTYRPGMDPKKVIRDVVGHLFTPMLYTSLTSAVGFLSLLLTPIPPVQVFGAFVAFGILLAFLLTIVLIPAYIVRMSPKAIAKMASHTATPHTETLLARLLRKTGVFAVRRAKLVVVAALLMLAVSVAGISRIEINDNPVRWFKANHPIRVADEVLNRHFAGTYDAFVVFEVDNTRDIVAAVDDAMFETTDTQQLDALDELMSLAEEAQTQSKVFQSPEMLHMITEIQDALDSLDLVGKTNALADVAKIVNRELRSGEERDYAIPASAAGVAQALMQFQSSHRPHDLWHIVTPDFSSTAIWVQLKSGDNQDMSGVIRALDDYLKANPLPDNIKVRWAGKTFINVVWQDGMVKGMLVSLLGAFVVVFLMMAMLFRSARTGLLAMVPLSVTILGVYGIIGWIGKDYDMPIAVLSSLTLGLSVDFAIHFIERTRALQRSSGSFDVAIKDAFEEPARAIARNAIVIAIGFTPYYNRWVRACDNPRDRAC
jgi:predicted RND superfamily exporter protein